MTKTYPNDSSGNLFNHIITANQLKNDAALGRALGVAAPLISKIRNGALDVGPSLMIRIHEVTGLEIAEIKKLISVREVVA